MATIKPKAEKFTLGQNIQAFCSDCDSEQNHTIEAVTAQGKITRAACAACGTSSTYARGVKTSVSAPRGKTASPYDRTRRYRKGQAMTHDKFGHGEVTGLVEPQKIDVLFADQTRRLIHSQE